MNQQANGSSKSSKNLQTSGDVVQVYTLFDITATGVTGPYRKSDLDITEWELQRNQQRNWETLIQVVGMRAQPDIVSEPIKTTGSFTDYNFGLQYTGELTVWSFVFRIEHMDVYSNKDSDVGVLLSDMQHVPIISGLTETASLAISAVITDASINNFYAVRLG